MKIAVTIVIRIKNTVIETISSINVNHFFLESHDIENFIDLYKQDKGYNYIWEYFFVI